jgi:hypothetical protein
MVEDILSPGSAWAEDALHGFICGQTATELKRSESLLLTRPSLGSMAHRKHAKEMREQAKSAAHPAVTPIAAESNDAGQLPQGPPVPFGQLLLASIDARSGVRSALVCGHWME